MCNAVARERGIEAAQIALGDTHGEHTGAAVVGRDGGTAAPEDVVDGLGRDLQGSGQIAHSDAFRPFPDDLSALLIGQSATATHVKYTFLFLANFVQARLLPAQAEKAPRACTQCRKSAQGADLTSFVKCIAPCAHCIAFRVFRIAFHAHCTAHRVLCSASSAPRITSSGTWQMASASRIAHGVACIPSSVSRPVFPASCSPENGKWRASSAPSIALFAARPPSCASRCPDIAHGQSASRLLLDAHNSTV